MNEAGNNVDISAETVPTRSIPVKHEALKAFVEKHKDVWPAELVKLGFEAVYPLYRIQCEKPHVKNYLQENKSDAWTGDVQKVTAFAQAYGARSG